MLSSLVILCCLWRRELQPVRKWPDEQPAITGIWWPRECAAVGQRVEWFVYFQTRAPFPLRLRFKPMLQRRIE